MSKKKNLNKHQDPQSIESRLQTWVEQNCVVCDIDCNLWKHPIKPILPTNRTITTSEATCSGDPSVIISVQVFEPYEMDHIFSRTVQKLF
jgi:hypothetical protein